MSSADQTASDRVTDAGGRVAIRAVVRAAVARRAKRQAADELNAVPRAGHAYLPRSEFHRVVEIAQRSGRVSEALQDWMSCKSQHQKLSKAIDRMYRIGSAVAGLGVLMFLGSMAATLAPMFEPISTAKALPPFTSTVQFWTGLASLPLTIGGAYKVLSVPIKQIDLAHVGEKVRRAERNLCREAEKGLEERFARFQTAETANIGSAISAMTASEPEISSDEAHGIVLRAVEEADAAVEAAAAEHGWTALDWSAVSSEVGLLDFSIADQATKELIGDRAGLVEPPIADYAPTASRPIYADLA